MKTETAMTLSPAAQAVLDAFLRAPCDNKLSVAAALRALTKTTLVDEGEMRGWICRAITTEDILDIAAELEGAN